MGATQASRLSNQIYGPWEPIVLQGQRALHLYIVETGVVYCNDFARVVAQGGLFGTRYPYMAPMTPPALSFLPVAVA